MSIAPIPTTQGYIRTDETILDSDIDKVFDFDIADSTCFQTCAGEWRREGALWRFYRDPEWDD